MLLWDMWTQFLWEASSQGEEDGVFAWHLLSQWRGPPGALVTQHLQPALGRNQTAAEGGNCCSQKDRGRCGVYGNGLRSRLRGHLGELRRSWGAASTCSAVLPHFSHRDMLYLFILRSPVYIFVTSIPGLYNFLRNHFLPRNFEFGELWQEAGRLWQWWNLSSRLPLVGNILIFEINKSAWF